MVGLLAVIPAGFVCAVVVAAHVAGCWVLSRLGRRHRRRRSVLAFGVPWVIDDIPAGQWIYGVMRSGIIVGWLSARWRAYGAALPTRRDPPPPDPPRPCRRHQARPLSRPRRTGADPDRPGPGRGAGPRIARQWKPAAIYTSGLQRCVVTGAKIVAATGAPAIGRWTG